MRDDMWACRGSGAIPFPAGLKSFDEPTTFFSPLTKRAQVLRFGERKGGEGGRRAGASRLMDARSSLTRQAAFFSTLNNSPLSPAQCDALGRRAAEGVPDSRAEAKGLGSAERDERPVRGRRHLVVKSQVKRQSRQKGDSPGGFEHRPKAARRTVAVRHAERSERRPYGYREQR